MGGGVVGGVKDRLFGEHTEQLKRAAMRGGSLI